VVDQDGNGDYESVQAAIDGAKSFPSERIRTLVREGVYDGKLKLHSWNPKVDLIGESRENTVLSTGSLRDDREGSKQHVLYVRVEAVRTR